MGMSLIIENCKVLVIWKWPYFNLTSSVVIVGRPAVKTCELEGTLPRLVGGAKNADNGPSYKTVHKVAIDFK